MKALRRTGHLTIVLVSFLACYGVTLPSYIGDTTRYAADIVSQAQGHATQFWEFNHLLWRPWGWVGYSLFGNWFARSLGDAPEQAAARFLILTSFICSAAALAILFLLLRKVVRPWVAAGIALAMSGSTSFLNFSHSGSSYIPALLFSVLALYWATTAAEHPREGQRQAFLAGISFALACALWFPYSLTGLGMVAVLYWWPSRDSVVWSEQRPLRRALIGKFILSLGVLAVLLYMGGAAAKGVRNVSQLSQWILESDNGNSVSRTAMRAVTGLARSVWGFGWETMYLKRWLFADPYNQAPLATFLFSLGGKLASFYAAIAAVLWVLWKERRWMLLIFLSASVPLVVFAVALFEPSSPERFLPIFPFAYAAFAVVLSQVRRSGIPSACIVVLLAGTTVFNLQEEWRDTAEVRLAETRQRVRALERSVQPGALVLVTTIDDDLYDLPSTHPLDHSLSSPRFQVKGAVPTSSRAIVRWRSDVAQRAERQWELGGEVWLSERLLAERPRDRWRWVEGDDRRIRWRDLPASFRQLETDVQVPLGGDGFVRLAQSPANRDRLAQWDTTAGEMGRPTAGELALASGEWGAHR